jgi:predicted  nucleic acid-binding Zn-ribbon protein
MADNQDNSSEIKDTDIIFDCPHCGKSLAIDYRGAGLTIPCSDCGKMVEVPIPEGMEIGDIDSTEEEQEIQILNLRRLLSVAESKNMQLEEELSELRDRREILEHEHSQNITRNARLSENMKILQTALTAAVAAAGDIAEDIDDESDVQS